MVSIRGKKYQGNNRFLRGLVFAAALLFGLTAAAVVCTAAEKPGRSGWVRESGQTFYYVRGVPVSGWKKISKKWYFFDAKTNALARNQIAGDKKKGYYYVDSRGIRVNDKTMNLAVKCIRKNAKKAKTPVAKLEACYWYFVNKCSYRHYPNVESKSMVPSFARDMFRNRAGDCYRGAAALTYCAKALGFETRVGMGGVYRGEYAHGWNEIKVNGKWYISDISRGRARNQNMFKRSYKKYPLHLRVDKYYVLTAKSGKIKWKKRVANTNIH